MADIARYLSYTDIAYRDDDDDFGKKHVRIAKQNLTLTYKPKCYSMPDLLQVDTFKESNHRHPKMQLSTRKTNNAIDVRSYLPKKTSTFKKITNCLGRWTTEKSFLKSNSKKFVSLTRQRCNSFDPIIENRVFNGPTRPTQKLSEPPVYNRNNSYERSSRVNKNIVPVSKSTVFNQTTSSKLQKTVISKTLGRPGISCHGNNGAHSRTTNIPFKQTQKWCSENNLFNSSSDQTRLQFRRDEAKSSNKRMENKWSRNEVANRDHYRKRSLSAVYNEQSVFNTLTYQTSPSIFV